MVSRLSHLQRRLERLRRIRSLLRGANAAFSLIVIVGGILLAVLALDWLFDLPVVERAVLLALATIGLVWGFNRFVRPHWCQRESALKTALLVERQHDIDSDLVAALQFHDAQPALGASTQLASAVMQYVAEAAPRIHVFQGLPVGPFLKRFAAALAMLTVWALLTVSAPQHVKAFGHRLFFESHRYPTRTQIERIHVGAVEVYSSQKAQEVADCRAPEGQPVDFTVACSGSLPESVAVFVQASGGGTAAKRIELRPRAAPSSRSAHREYVGRLPRLVEGATYRIRAGDAQSGIATLRLIPLPIVDLKLAVTPPAYASDEAPSKQINPRSTLVLEGSSVQFLVRSTNGKPLKTVTGRFDAAGVSRELALAPTQTPHGLWATPANRDPLVDIRRELRFELQVIDEDGLEPALPLHGMLRVRPDEPPSAAIELVHRVALPTARPMLTFRASDDFGIKQAELLVDVERQSPMSLATSGGALPQPSSAENPDGTAKVPASSSAETIRRFPLTTNSFPASNLFPARASQLPVAGTHALDLAPLDLSPGDRLKLAIEVTDERGENRSGQQITSEVRVLEIADEAAVLAAIREGDQRSEAQLNELIRRQLNIGDRP